MCCKVILIIKEQKAQKEQKKKLEKATKERANQDFLARRKAVPLKYPKQISLGTGTPEENFFLFSKLFSFRSRGHATN